MKKKLLTIISALAILPCVCFGIIKAYKSIYTIGLDDDINARRAEMQCFFNTDECSAEALIAHGGGIQKFTYTNCKEAVEDSLKRGFRYIELDLLITADNKIIAAHNWNDLSNLTGKTVRELENMSLEQLKELKINDIYTPLGGSDICEFMRTNPQIILVTDKIKNYDLLLKEIPFPDRMIVETFNKYQYQKAINAGFRYPAFSTHKKLDVIEKHQFPIVVMSSGILRIPGNLERIKKLHNQKITILVHGTKICDQPDFVKEHLGKHISKIYTDTWSPR